MSYRVEAAFGGKQQGRGRVFEEVEAMTAAGALSHALARLTRAEKRDVRALMVEVVTGLVGVTHPEGWEPER